MNRILILGCPGSGKSTFAKALAKQLELPLYHLDLLYHLADRTTASREVFDERLREVLKQPEWIIDGNYSRTVSLRLQHADTVFLFDLPTEDCVQGVENRIGKPRDDMPWQETEFDPEFKEYILSFRTSQLPKLLQQLNSAAEHIVLIPFHSREEADAFLNAHSR